MTGTKSLTVLAIQKDNIVCPLLLKGRQREEILGSSAVCATRQQLKDEDILE